MGNIDKGLIMKDKMKDYFVPGSIVKDKSKLISLHPRFIKKVRIKTVEGKDIYYNDIVKLL